MADQSDATQADADAQSQADTTQDDATQADASKDTISLDEARKLRSEANNLRKRLKDAEDAAQAAAHAEAKKKGEWETVAKKLESELAEANQKLAERDLKDRRIAAAKAAKLPDDMADRLRGETDEELEADAKDLAKHLRTQEAPENDAGERTPRGTKKPDKNAWSDPAKWGLRS